MISFTNEQIEQLRAHYGKIKRVNPDGGAYQALHRFVSGLDRSVLVRLASAKVPWLSTMANLELLRLPAQR
jgi:hypothetical protein